MAKSVKIFILLFEKVLKILIIKVYINRDLKMHNHLPYIGTLLQILCGMFVSTLE